MIFRYIILSFLLIFNSFLNANEYKFDLMDDIFDLDLEQLKTMKLTTASKSIQVLDVAPTKIIIITKEQIEQRGYRGLDDLLNDLPAIQILRHADSGIINQIGIRGIMGNNYFKILQDGIEIDQTDGEFMSVSIQYPLIGIEKVEILYGAASVIYGADAMSGVINLVTSSKENGQIGVWAGKDRYKYFYANQSIKINDGLLSYKAHLHTDQDYNFDKEYPDNFKNTNQSNNFQPHETKSASLKYLKGGFDIGANYSYSSESTLISMNGDNANKNRNIFDKNANLNTQKINTYLRYETDIFWDMSSTTTLSYSQTEFLNDSYFRNRYTGCDADYNCFKGYQYSKSKKYSLEETLNKQIKNHDITIGTNFDWYDVTPIGYQGIKKGKDKFYLIQDGNNAYLSNIKAPNYKQKWHNIAFYIQDQITLNDNFEIALAARYDENSNYESSFNPRIALIHKNNSLTQKFIYSQAFLAPSNNVKYKSYGALNKDSNGELYFNEARVGNSDLQPEKSKTYEYNLFLHLSSNDQIVFSTYYTNIKDIILIEEPLPSGKYNDIQINNPKSAQNAADSHIYGGDISYMGHSYFSGYDINYWANYSYINGKIDYEYDYNLPFLASHVFKAGSTFRYKDFTFSPSLRWLSPIKVAPFDDITDRTTNGYFIANLYASYNITKSQKIALRVDNIFDEHYFTPRYNSSKRYVSPQDTRMTYISYTINF
ncbi:hypothetical protein CRU92_07185 [Arcobacter sp. FW59]|nr:hypothetical protein CRU92_07185 [Arcobacter sp. FW59]